MKFTITLEYQGKQYSFVDTFENTGLDKDYDAVRHATYMYTDGNYGCDCNRSYFIAEHCDKDFPDMECGHTIQLVSIVPVVEETVYAQHPSGLYIPVAQ